VAHILLSGRCKSNNFSPFFHHSRLIAQKPRKSTTLTTKRVIYQQRIPRISGETTTTKMSTAEKFWQKNDANGG
jgi:hypothetical protein